MPTCTSDVLAANNNSNYFVLMRFILRYRFGLGQKKSQRFYVNPCNSTDDVIDHIQKKIGKSSTDFMVKYKSDKITYRVIRGWSLTVYEIREGAEFELEMIERDELETKSKYANKYLINLLGQQKQELNKIAEEAEGEDDEESGDQSKREFDIRKYLDGELERVLKMVQKGKWGNVIRILQQLPDNIPEQDTLQLQKQKPKLLNELGQGGWGAIHYSVFCNRPQILNQLLDRQVDINKCTTDGWLPLQLAANRKNQDIIRILLYNQNVRVNELTARGTALHIAAKAGATEIMKALLDAGADSRLTDEKGKNCLEVCANEEAMNLIRNSEDSKVRHDSANTEVVEEVAILKGLLNKAKAVFLSLTERYVVLDPYQGTFIRYDDEESCPKRPKQIIPLSSISYDSIRMIPSKQKNWQMKKEYFYFAFEYPKKMFHAAKNQKIAIKWVLGLQQAVRQQQFLSKNNSVMVKDIDKPVIILDDKTGSIKKIGGKPELSPQKSSSTLPKPQLPSAKTNLFKVNSASQRSSGSDRQSPRMPINATNGMSISSRPSDKGVSFGDQPYAPIRREDSQDDDRSPSPMKPGNQEISMNIKQNKKEDMKAAKNELTHQLNKIMNQKVNFSSFEIVQVLGSGAFGKVFLARHIKSGIVYALKALKKKDLIVKKQLKYAVTEAKVLKQANHPFIINLHYAFQTPNYLYLALDYCPGKDLSFHLARQITFGEDQSRIYTAELLLAIQHLHSKNILYRDLKPENILLDADGHIKLADFGLSKDTSVDNKTQSFCGSPAYLSPEMLNRKEVGKQSDIYGMGCVLYQCLVGEPPYYSDDMPSLFENIRQGRLKYPKHVSDDAKSLISGLLERDPKKRLGSKGLDEVKKHPFFKAIDWKVAAARGLPPPVRQYRPEDDDSDQDVAINKRTNFTDFDYQKDSKKINRLNDFSFVRTQ